MREVEAVKHQVEQKEPTIVDFFILQNAKLWMLELPYKLFDKFCDFNSFEDIEMETASLYLALSQPSLAACINPKNKEAWINIRK